jgi:hypothetical protein
MESVASLRSCRLLDAFVWLFEPVISWAYVSVTFEQTSKNNKARRASTNMVPNRKDNLRINTTN